MSSLALLAVGYVSLVVFAVVAAVRSIKIARLPVHLRWELAPVPHPEMLRAEPDDIHMILELEPTGSGRVGASE